MDCTGITGPLEDDEKAWGDEKGRDGVDEEGWNIDRSEDGEGADGTPFLESKEKHHRNSARMYTKITFKTSFPVGMF